MSGFVSFVGSGPGDPELLTVKAVDRLRRADVILFDDLSSGMGSGSQRIWFGFGGTSPNGAPLIKLLDNCLNGLCLTEGLIL